MKKMLSLILALALVFSLAAASASAADSPKKMKIAFCTWAGYAPLFIAKENGYFADQGYDVEIVIIEDESTYGAAFVSNSIQALGQVLDRDIIQFDAGAPEQYVCTMDASTGGDGLIATAEIKTMDDLVKATIRVIDDPSYADHIREDLRSRLQDERSSDRWNSRLAEIYAGVNAHEIHEFTSVPRLPPDETDLYVEYCHIHPKLRNILGIASLVSFREDGKKHHAIEFFPRRSNSIGDLK